MIESGIDGDSMAKLFESYPRHLEFPLGGEIPIPTETERAIVFAIDQAMPLSQGAVEILRERTLCARNAYALATFSVRTAVLAARTHTPNLLEVSALCLMIDGGRVDWRDVLVALSIIEACANVIGANFDEVVRKAATVATPERRQTVIDDYLSRTHQMRGVEVMGFTIRGTGNDFTFVRSA